MTDASNKITVYIPGGYGYWDFDRATWRAVPASDNFDYLKVGEPCQISVFDIVWMIIPSQSYGVPIAGQDLPRFTTPPSAPERNIMAHTDSPVIYGTLPLGRRVMNYLKKPNWAQLGHIGGVLFLLYFIRIIIMWMVSWNIPTPPLPATAWWVLVVILLIAMIIGLIAYIMRDKQQHQ